MQPDPAKRYRFKAPSYEFVQWGDRGDHAAGIRPAPGTHPAIEHDGIQTEDGGWVNGGRVKVYDPASKEHIAYQHVSFGDFVVFGDDGSVSVLHPASLEEYMNRMEEVPSSGS